MATKTSNYEFNKPEQNDFYDVDVQNENWDKVDEELSEFDDSGVTEDIKSFPDFLSKFVTGNKVAITLRNLKAGLQFVLHAGQIVNNCVTDNAGLPLSAAQGKALMDKYTQLYSEMGTITNGIFISNQSLDIITKTGNYRGANISELIPYTTPSSWCGIKAYVQSDNAAFFNIITNNNIVINAYRDGDGTYKIYPLALKSDLFGHSICVAGDGGTQNFNIGDNGFLFIPYTSTTFGIYYIGRDSAKLILGTEDSDFKVSISGTTCMLQNNKGWNIFCVFIAGQ